MASVDGPKGDVQNPEPQVLCSRPHPLDAGNYLSQWSVLWFTPLVRLACKRGLTLDDLWAAPLEQAPDRNAKLFWAARKAELSAKSNPTLAGTLVRAFFWDFATCGFLLFCFMFFQLAQPLIIQKLMLHIRSEEPLENGIAIVAAMFFVSGMSSLCISSFMRVGKQSGVKVKTAVMRVVYEHAIELSAEGRSHTSTGKTTNLMSVDSEKLFMCWQFVHLLWMTPTMLLVVGVLIVVNVGWIAVFGWLLVVGVVLPAQHVCAKLGGRARKQSVAYTDERVKFTNEVVQGIRAAKLYSWEDAIFRRATDTRRKETSWIVASLFWKSFVREFLLIIVPPLALALIVGLSMLRGSDVDGVLALTVLGYLNTLRFPLNLFNFAMAAVQDALVSCARISDFLKQPVVSRRAAVTSNSLPISVTVSDANFAWPSHDSSRVFTLHVPHLCLQGPSRVAVVGRVAAGKSSLLAGMLGEMECTSGSCSINGRVAYMGQTPWIRNMSIRENIVFGNAFDPAEYERVLAACSLSSDLAILKDGDLTDIGEKGINLSGGQKARVALARCLYAVAIGVCNILIMDCPFDALDIPTGEHVFAGSVDIAANALMICAMSAQIQLLSGFTSAIVVKDGQITHVEDASTVLENYPELSTGDHANARAPKLIITPAKAPAIRNMGGATQIKKLIKQDTSKRGSIAGRMALRHLGGAVNGDFRSGVVLAICHVTAFTSGQFARVAADFAILHWAMGEVSASVPFTILPICALLLILRLLGASLTHVGASRSVHRRTFWCVLRAPVTSFFDITTSGEITNKFGKDLELTDTQLPANCVAFLSNGSMLLSIAILGIYAVPWFAILILIFVIAVVCVSRLFSPASRDLKRLDGSSRSPIYNCFSETLCGLDTIRAWNLQDQFLDEQLGHMKKNLTCYFNACMSETWVQIRLEMLSTFAISALAFIAVSLKESVDAELVGLALVYSIQLTAMMQHTCQLVVMISQFMTACERVLSFASLEQEPELSVKSDGNLSADWPLGSITFDNVQMRYRDGDLVLRGVSFAVEAGQRIGICGRTGAGKSSVLQVFFRVCDPCGGSISIDGVDTRSIGLRKLRSSLAIVPQEAVVFSGSLRSNLDPFGFVQSDDVLMEIMERVGLQDLAQAGLASTVAENGSNLSQGQRQLLCIARIMVQPRRITVLDEATSSMDAETDRAVQRAMTEQWRAASTTGAATTMTIAHRLSTILDYDKILVLAQGQVAEFDTPAALRADRTSLLYAMLHDAGDAPKHDEAGAGDDDSDLDGSGEFGSDFKSMRERTPQKRRVDAHYFL